MLPYIIAIYFLHFYIIKYQQQHYVNYAVPYILSLILNTSALLYLMNDILGIVFGMTASALWLSLAGLTITQ